MSPSTTARSRRCSERAIRGRTGPTRRASSSSRRRSASSAISRACSLWTLLGGAIFFAVARRHIADNRLLVALLLSPAAVLCVISGQSSLITAAMLVTIFAWLDRRPVAAGILIGLLTLKPQLGVLFPIMLIASGRWRVFASAAVTTLAHRRRDRAGVRPAGVGRFRHERPGGQQSGARRPRAHRDAVLHDRLHEPARHRSAVQRRHGGAALRLGLLRSLLSFWAFRMRRDADPLMLMALFLACSVAAVPYMLSYDTLAPYVCGAAAARRGIARRNGPALRAARLLAAADPDGVRQSGMFRVRR